VLCNRELRDDFKGVVSETASTETFNILYRDILQCVINVMANSLIQSQAMMARIESDNLRSYTRERYLQTNNMFLLSP